MDSSHHGLTPTPRLLLDDHIRLRRLFDDVLDQFRDDHREETRQAWALFEDALTMHIEIEDALLLPAFRAFDPAEARALGLDHAQFRRTLDELAIMVELHAIRADVASAFIDKLTAHSRREDVGMYAWAETSLNEAAYLHLARQLAGIDRAAP